MSLKIKGEWFLDDHGRTVHLRGVNLGASTKVPLTPNGATHIKTDFSDHESVSFVGRPFPLKEANEHFKRLKQWGFNCLRFLVTWEAIEHSGPGKYDIEYLDYIEEVLKIAEGHGFYSIIEPHQDVWSRMTGGSGAPGWTFEKVGLDFTKFNAAGAALVMQYHYDPTDPSKFPLMHWTNNLIRLPNRVMWTLFFGGNDFAPSCKVDGINAQDYLLNHYFNALKQVALRVKDNNNVIGFDNLNEPSSGFIELKVDGSGFDFSDTMGHAFTPIDAMVTGAGYPRIIGYRELKRFGIKQTRKDEINKNKVSCWLEGFESIWKKEGVWEMEDNGNPTILKNDYFVEKEGKKVDFYRDYFSPFITKYAEAIRTIIPEAQIFFHGPGEDMLSGKELLFNVPDNVVNAAHWYDGPTVGTRRAMLKASFDVMTGKPVMGKQKVQKMFIRQLSTIKNFSKAIHGGIPTFIGEFGLPYDLGKRAAYEKFKTEPDTAWDIHVKALNMYYNALDANLLHSTQWNYTADNTNEWGDQWNIEDLSIFSRDQQIDPNDINSGGRAIKGFCRPRFIHCAGIPLKMEFNVKEGTFNFEFDGDSSITSPTVLYVPKIQYPNGYKISVTEGEIDNLDEEQLVLIKILKDGIHSVSISKV